MTRNRTLRRLVWVAATLAAGALPSSCQMTLRDSFVRATKDTFFQATTDLFSEMFAPQGLAFGASTGT